MYNCNALSDYRFDQGEVLRMDVWDGWKEFLGACVTGHKHNVQRYLSKEDAVLRYQQRVALYMAAYFGHLELAEWLQKKGVRADEAVGIHPYREWCCETDHPDITKCPIHAAAEAGQLLILKAFIAYNVLCMQCQNPVGQTPLRICIQYRHKDCVSYLIMKMWSVVSFPKISIPMSIYVKVKLWLFWARKDISVAKKLKWAAEFKTRVGDTVVVDGYTEPQMTSKSLQGLHRDRWKKVMGHSNNVILRKDQAFGCKVFDFHSITQIARHGETFKLPPLNEKSNNFVIKKKSSAQKSGEDDIFQSTWTAQVPLPPFPNCSTRPRHLKAPQAAFLLNSSLESFSKHSGKSPRENAIYCLSLVSEFKEKPWLQQLDMARMLARKSIHNL